MQYLDGRNLMTEKLLLLSLLANDVYTRMSLLSLAAMLPDQGKRCPLRTTAQDLSSFFLGALISDER